MVSDINFSHYIYSFTFSKNSLKNTRFFMGYPKSAITSGIIEDDYHNKVDKEKFAKSNAKRTLSQDLRLKKLPRES
jgi:hypothetical protein